MFALNIEIINCFTYSRKLYTKMYMSRKWCWHDATILSVDWRCQQNVGGADVHTSSANRSHAGIAFTHWFKNGFFAPQGRHVAPINVKFGTGERTIGLMPRDKFHIYRSRNVRVQPLKLSKCGILSTTSPLRGTRLQNSYAIISICMRL